jgi:hypothetical protein
MLTSSGPGQPAKAARLTPDGARHAATRLAMSADDSQRKWAALPELASVALVGGPRAGAEILALVSSDSGEPQTLIATQRYGQGRSMVFAGEASWRWRMMMPTSDQSYETIWRQLTRWLAAAAPGPVTIAPMAVTIPGTTEPVTVLIRDEEFKPVTDAEVYVRLTSPDSLVRRLPASLVDPRDGRYAVSVRFEHAGVYKVEASSTRGGRAVGDASRYVLSGGADVEMSDPRLNEDVLRRVALATGGRYLPAAEADAVYDLVRSAALVKGPHVVRDLWQNGWILAAIVGLLATEWVVRRRVGFA